MTEFDLIIIGSGSGNSIPNEAMADWRIAIVEEGRFGGTCLNAGCIPSKMLIYPADVLTEASDGERLGIHTRSEGVDWPAIRDRIFGRIDPISAGGRDWRAGQPNVTAYFERATMVAPNTFEVGSERITAPRIVLAAGARPQIPSVPGLDQVPFHTSDTIMRLPELPAHLVIFGSGFVANEMAHVFRSYGSKVTLAARGQRLLRGHDSEVAEAFLRANRHRFDIRLGVEAAQVTPIDSIAGSGRGSGAPRFTVEFTDGTGVQGDCLLVATGRIPNGDRLGVEAGGVELDEDGYVRCDAQLRTTAEGVWALGDIRNRKQLKHLANRDAGVIRHNLVFPEDPIQIDERAVPYAVFANPQFASVGATEDELRESGRPYVVGRRDYAGTAYGWAMEDQVGFAKVLIDPETRQVLGAHILGYQASILIQTLTQGMQFGLTADQMARDTIYPHPALSEVVENALLEGLSQL
jgi:mycothione reductase